MARRDDNPLDQSGKRQGAGATTKGTKRPAKREDPNYTQRSYLLPQDVARNLDILAAMRGVKHSELAEEIFRDYLKKHAAKLPRG